MGRPRQRTPELRTHVLATARETLSSVGIAGFTTKQLAVSAGTSVPAIYELFGDKSGIVRELFFLGFHELALVLGDVPKTESPHADLEEFMGAFRTFVVTNPVLAKIMFGQPFADFEPKPSDLAAADLCRKMLVRAVKRCLVAGEFSPLRNEPHSGPGAATDHGEAVDIAHVLLAFVQGFAMQEAAGWIGRSPSSIDRRWSLALRALLPG